MASVPPGLGKEPTDPAAMGMRQLVYIACAYGSASAIAGAFNTPIAVIVLIVAAGLAHAAIASSHGLRRGEQLTGRSDGNQDPGGESEARRSR